MVTSKVLGFDDGAAAEKTNAGGAIVAASVALGLAGDLLLRAWPWGVNAAIWLACVCAVALALPRFKLLAIVFSLYVGIVATFETLIGVLQPTPESTITITTFDRDGTAHERVVSKLVSGEQVYVAANHWPRAWFERALANPRIAATIDGKQRDYEAILVVDEEHARIDAEHPLPLVFRILTGFPPRYFVRLDPR